MLIDYKFHDKEKDMIKTNFIISFSLDSIFKNKINHPF